MITEEIDQLLTNLKLRRMREVVPRELRRAAEQGTAPDELLVRLLREQWAYAQERTAHNRLESARIPEKFDLGTFPYLQQTGVQRSQIEQLSHLEFLSHGGNVVFIGEPGVGKTGIATGLLLRALQAGHGGRFIKAQDLFDQMYASLADRTTRVYLNTLARLPLLLIDSCGAISNVQRRRKLLVIPSCWRALAAHFRWAYKDSSHLTMEASARHAVRSGVGESTGSAMASARRLASRSTAV